MQRTALVAGPAVPSTPAQHGRRDRILETATAMLSAGGEDALQMKELSQRADVSLATLYRYFPALFWPELTRGREPPDRRAGRASPR
jgi:AcrR family transcriptional regulator